MLFQARPDWMHRGACVGLAPTVMHPESGRLADLDHAKAICSTCPVIAQCRDYALSNRIVFGIWGGTHEYDRDQVWRAQRRAAKRAA